MERRSIGARHTTAFTSGTSDTMNSGTLKIMPGTSAGIARSGPSDPPPLDCNLREQELPAIKNRDWLQVLDPGVKPKYVDR